MFALYLYPNRHSHYIFCMAHRSYGGTVADPRSQCLCAFVTQLIAAQFQLSQMLIPCHASTYDDGGHRTQPPPREVDGVDCLDAHELIDREIPAFHTTTRGGETFRGTWCQIHACKHLVPKQVASVSCEKNTHT